MRVYPWLSVTVPLDRALPRAVPPGPGGHVMRSLRNAVVLLAFLVLAVLPVAAAAQPGYVALGDSVDFGIGSSTGAGWVVPFNGFLSSPSVFNAPVELVNLAVPGAETEDVARAQLA